MATVMATVMATATAMAMVMVMLKMDENVNLRLERHVTELFFTVYSFPPGTGLYIFQNIG